MASFLDRVVVGVNKGVKSVSEGSKTFMEKAKLNTQIQDLETEKNQIIMNMGTLVYNLHASGAISIEQCMGMCGEIASIEQQVAELQRSVQELDAQRYQQPYAPPIEDGIQCSCGFINKNTAKFCARCGSQIQ